MIVTKDKEDETDESGEEIIRMQAIQKLNLKLWLLLRRIQLNRKWMLIPAIIRSKQKSGCRVLLLADPSHRYPKLLFRYDLRVISLNA